MSSPDVGPTVAGQCESERSGLWGCRVGFGGRGWDGGGEKGQEGAPPVASKATWMLSSLIRALSRSFHLREKSRKLDPKRRQSDQSSGRVSFLACVKENCGMHGVSVESCWSI